MSTESIDPRYARLEQWPLPDVVRAMWEGQVAAIAALEGGAIDAIAVAASAAALRLRDDGARLVYAGAGTSGRIAIQDGVELVPTFGWGEDRLVYLMAGGQPAITGAVEGAEDDADAARGAVAGAEIGPHDVVIAVAASGRTPFTCAVLSAARARGALTIAIANNPDTPLLALADHPILADTGAEVLAGSTRMKAGTAQKAALNMLSTAMMIALGRVHAGRMVAMHASNDKLRDRARNTVAELAGVSPAQAAAALHAAHNDIRTAVLVARGADVAMAADLLARHDGHLGGALAELAAGRPREA